MTVKIRQDPQGRWWIRIDWHQRRASRLMPSQERAIEVAKKIADALDLYGEKALEMIRRPAPMTKAKRVPTGGEYAFTWLRNLDYQNLKRTTRMVYTWAVRGHFIPAFGNVPLTDVGYSEMKAFIISKKSRYSPDSLGKMVGACRVMFNEAIREGILNKNPCTHLGQFYQRSRRETAVPRSDVFTLNVTRLSRIVKEGREYRDVEVKEVRNEERMTMDTIRLDSGETVSYRPLQGHERNLTLFPAAVAEPEKVG